MVWRRLVLATLLAASLLVPGCSAHASHVSSPAGPSTQGQGGAEPVAADPGGTDPADDGLPDDWQADAGDSDAESPSSDPAADAEEESVSYILDGRDLGPSRRMAGDICLYCVFVEDDESHWSSEEIDEMYEGIWTDTAYLETRAAEYGVYLKFSSVWELVSVPAGEKDRWLDYLMETHYGNPDHDYPAVQAYFEEGQGADDVPFLFFFNKDGRCYCYMSTHANGNQTEVAVYYPSTMSADRSIAHELYHIYGARDLYYPQAVQEAAVRYFPDSAMLVGGRELDELTAYLIGWTDTPGPDAAAFIDEVSWVTEADADADRG